MEQQQQPPEPAQQPQQPQQAMQQPQPPQQPQQAMQQPQQPQQPQLQPDAYQAIIDQQQAQINALIAQTNAQSAQITQLVQGGAQIQAQAAPQHTQPQPFVGVQNMPQPHDVQFPNVYQPYDAQAAANANWQPPSMLDDQDYSLESLAGEIGKKD